MNKAKQTSLFKAMIDKFPDDNLIDVNTLKKKLDD